MDVLEEVWEPIPGFPLYSVSNLGRVMNIKTERPIKPQLTPQGVVYVPMYADGRNQTKSVKVLVAKAFLEGETRVFNTPINRDGNKTNNRVDNLLWRPLWFAVKYSHQFNKPYVHEKKGPVYECETEARFEDIFEAGITFGLLFREVYLSTYTGIKVAPTGQRFRIPGTIQVR